MSRLALLALMIGVLVGLTIGATVTEAKVVGLWLFDDGKGNVAKDSSGNGHDGKITGGKWIDGVFGKALKFDMGTDMVVENHDDFNFTKAVTIEAWAYFEDLPHTHGGIPRKEGQWVLHPTKSGAGYEIRFYVGIGGWKSPAITKTKLKFSKDWHHFAGTYDGKTIKVYIDGEVDAERNQGGDLSVTANPLRFSNDCCGGRRIIGALDEIRISDTALSKAEIQKSMKGLGKQPVQTLSKLTTTWGRVKERLERR